MNRSEIRIQKLIKEFEGLGSWEERYKSLIEKGKSLVSMEDSLKVDVNLVKGCQSQVWFSVSLNPDKSLHFEADSDALIVKGLVATLLEVFQDLSVNEILETSPQFLKDLGFEAHLSPSRANGLNSMLKQIVYYATAYQFIINKN